MKTSERDTHRADRSPPLTCWREIVTSGADMSAIEGLALEQFIDLQRGKTGPVGEIG